MAEQGIVSRLRVFAKGGWVDARTQSDSVDPGQNISMGTANAPVQAAAKPCQLGAYVSAPIANTKPIYVSFSGAGTTSLGVELNPGDREWFPVLNTSQLWCVTGTATQTAQVLAC